MAPEHHAAVHGRDAEECARRFAAPFFFAMRAKRRQGNCAGPRAPEHVRARRRHLRERSQRALGTSAQTAHGADLRGAVQRSRDPSGSRDRSHTAIQRAQRYHPALRRAVVRRARIDASKRPAPLRARAVSARGRSQPKRATRSFLAWATTAVSQVLSGGGAFAGYCRASLATAHTKAAKAARAVARQLFPLPLQSLLQLPGRIRSRIGYRRWAEAQATRSLALLSGLALSWEATGRPHVPVAEQFRANDAQKRVVTRLRVAAAAMVRASRGVELRDLAIGRGKLGAGWATLDALVNTARRLQADVPYSRASKVLGNLGECGHDGPESVDVPRVALPDVEPHFDLAPFLVEADVRAGYIDPSTLERGAQLESALTDAEEHALHQLNVELDAWLRGNPPFDGRACDKLLWHQLAPFLRELDKRGMLYADRDKGFLKCGFFCVRKEWDAQRRVWVLRLVLDRRPRNSVEQQVKPQYDVFPQGTCFVDVVLGEDEQLRLWTSDLPSFYYVMAVTDARARTNQFTEPLPEEQFADLRAVQELHERERARGDAADDTNGQVVFCLRTMAMGDRNATSFAQGAHVQLLRSSGLMIPEHTIAYRRPWPRSKVAQGVMIDDQVTTAIVPRTHPRAGDAAASARDVFERTLKAYGAVGLTDVPKKRRVDVPDAIVWGCEVRGRAGRAGAARTRRCAVAALAVSVALCGAVTVDLLRRLLGLWTDNLVYRREAFAAIGALYRFVEQYKTDPQHLVRTLPGPVRSELLILAALAPLLDVNLRAAVCDVVKVTDSSLDGACAVDVDVPAHAAQELWRHRLGPGRYATLDQAPGLRRGDAFVGEILEGCSARKRLQFRYRNSMKSINLGEARARRALWRTLGADAAAHSQRHLIAYDSRVVLGAAAKGRAHGEPLLREFRLTYPYLLASDCAEGSLWTDSERNTADSGSRSGPLPVPAPRRRWVHEFFAGDVGALDRRLAEPEPADAPIEDPLPHQLPPNAPFKDILGAVDRQSAMHAAVDLVKAPWLSGRSFRGSRTS